MEQFYVVVVYENDSSSAPRLFAFTHPDEVIKIQAAHAYSNVSVYKAVPKSAGDLLYHLSGPDLFKPRE